MRGIKRWDLEFVGNLMRGGMYVVGIRMIMEEIVEIDECRILV